MGQHDVDVTARRVHLLQRLDPCRFVVRHVRVLVLLHAGGRVDLV